MKRNEVIDLVKGIGIFLVVLGHHETVFTKYIYSFHMPLFFLISGVFHNNYENNYKVFLSNRIKKLIIPYFVFSSSLFVFWLFIGRKFGESALNNTPVSECLKGIFYGADIKGIASMEWGVPVWFLVCLFLVSNFYYFIYNYKIKNKILINILTGMFGYYLSCFPMEIFRIWHFDTALIALNFYTIGNIMKNKILKGEFSIKIFIISFIVSLFGNYFNGNVDMNTNYYSNMILFYISAFAGICLVFSTIKILKINSKIIEFIGENTLIILAYHGRAMSFIKMILILIFNISLPENNTLLNIIFSCFQIIMCIPIIFIFNNYLPFLLGKRKLKN